MNLFELFVKIGVDDQASGKLSKLSSSLGKGIATAAKIGTAAVGAAAAGITALTTQAVNSFSEYEQLAGGAQKIFDQMDFSQIATDASNAYKELGLSANQYLAVINDVGATFAATMGDEAGYEAAKTGLRAISDYASGTGKNVDELSQKFTLITRSTSSYQSIADQFSGILPATSAGFLEQAQAAGILSEKYTELTQVPVDEYQAAVSKMLEQGVADLGLAGNTAEESANTISGSLAAFSASWSNLVTGLADDNANMDTLINNFVDSAVNAVNNLIPRIGTALEGIGSLIAKLAPVVAGSLPSLISSLLPALLGAAESLISSVVSALPDIMSSFVNNVAPKIIGAAIGIFNAVVSALPELISTITSAFPLLVPQVIEGLVSIILAICENLPSIIEPILVMLPSLIENVMSAIMTSLPAIIEGLLNLLIALTPMIPQLINILLDALIFQFPQMWADTLIKLIPVLIVGLTKLVWELIKAVPGLLLALVKVILQPFIGLGTAVVTFGEWILGLFGKSWDDISNFFKEKVPQLISEFLNWIDELPEKIAYYIGLAIGYWISMPKRIASALLDIIIKFLEWRDSMADKIKEEIPKLIENVVQFFKNLPGEIYNTLIFVITKYLDFAEKFREKVKTEVPKIVDKFIEFFKNLPEKITNIGKKIVEGLFYGIKNSWNWLKNKVGGLVTEFIDGVKAGFDIHSPSRVFRDEIGKQLAAGLGLGWEDEFGKVKSDIEDSLDFNDASVGINSSIHKVGAGMAGGAFGGTSIGNININIDGAKYTDEQSLASAIALEIQNMTDRRAAVYA